jgi:hypothetical protein
MEVVLREGVLFTAWSGMEREKRRQGWGLTISFKDTPQRPKTPYEASLLTISQ